MRKVILYPSSKTLDSTWRKQWADPFISTWNLLERFKYINKLKSRNLLESFSFVDSADFLKKSSRELHYLKWLDYAKIPIDLASSLEESKKNSHNIFLIFRNTILKKTHQEPDAFLVYFFKHYSKTFRHCPECMKKGYHSWVHQVVFFDDCLFHKSKLQESCPKCFAKIPYEIHFSYFRNGFECKCGHQFYTGSRQEIYKDWSKKHTPVKSSKIEELFQIITSEKNKLKEINIQISELQRFNEKVCFTALKLATNNEFTIWRKSVKIYPAIPLGIRSKHFFEELYSAPLSSEDNKKIRRIIEANMRYIHYAQLCLYQVLKSIIRYLKRTFLKPYKKAIRQYIKERVSSKNIDPCAFAYVKFRREAEFGDSNSKEVELGAYYHNHRDWIYAIPRIQTDERDFFDLIANISTINDINNMQNWPDMLWIHQHLYGNYVIKRFYDWIIHCRLPNEIHDGYFYPKDKSPIVFLKSENNTYKILFSKNFM